MHSLVLAIVLAAAGEPSVDAQPRPIHVRGETTDGRAVTYPDDARGEPLVLVVSFTQAAGNLTDAWGDALEQRLAARAAICGVAVLDAVPGILRGIVKRAIDKNVGPPHIGKPNFITTFDGRALRDAAPPGNVDDPVIFVFRADGTLADAVRSAFSDDAERRVETALGAAANDAGGLQHGAKAPEPSPRSTSGGTRTQHERNPAGTLLR